jgi:hypothetical protein
MIMFLGRHCHACVSMAPLRFSTGRLLACMLCKFLQPFFCNARHMSVAVETYHANSFFRKEIKKCHAKS